MKKIVALTLNLTLIAFALLAPDPSQAQILAAASLAEQVKSLEFDRQLISGDIAHYSFVLPVGSGPFEEIRIHRVVREKAPNIPIRASKAIFLAHGDAWGFEATFLTSLATPEVPDQQALPVFLAENKFDVWGIDFRWSRVPASEEDLSFMADWGLGTDIGDLDRALAVARAVRLATGSGPSKLFLLGWSRGGQIGYAQLNAETQRPRFFRHVRGFIPMDIDFKTDQEANRQASCDNYLSLLEQIAEGALVSEFGVVAEIGDLAASAPEDPSPFLPSISNADLANLIGADVNPSGTIPHFHSVGGIVDPDTLETDLLHTRPEHWFAFLSSVSPFQPLKINLEGAALHCDEIDVPYDDHLARIKVPVFYVGATGAYGSLGLYSLTLLGSNDVSSLIINQTAEPEQDYGHSDLFLADGAEALVWRPILDWMRSH